MTVRRTIAFLAVTLATSLLAGCSTSRWSQLSNTFSSDEPLSISDPSFAKSKAGQVRQIRQIAENADSQSPAEQTQSAKSLVTRIQAEEDKVLRLEIIRALGKHRTPVAIEGLRIAVADSRDAVRAAACDALGEIGSPAALQLLADVLGSDPNLDVRVAATKAIARFDGPQAISALQPAINDADPALQYTAVQAMKKLHSEDLGNSVADWQNLARTISPARERIAAEDSDSGTYR